VVHGALVSVFQNDVIRVTVNETSVVRDVIMMQILFFGIQERSALLLIFDFPAGTTVGF
jgi:hypothetical protein